MNTSAPPILNPQQLQAVADEYYARLEFPEGAKKKPQFCICPIGLVGAGKTTVLKKIIKQLPTVRVSGDDIRGVFKSMGLPAEDPAYVADLVVERLKQKEGYNVAHDADMARPLVREFLQKTNRGGIKALWVRIAPPESFIVSKLKNYNHTWLFNDADHALGVYHKRKELHASLPELNDLPYLYTFDTSRPDLDKQVDEFATIAKRQLGTIKQKGAV